MKTKTIITGILLLFVGISVIYLVAGETRSGQTNVQSSTQTVAGMNGGDSTIDDATESVQRNNPTMSPVAGSGQVSQAAESAQNNAPPATPESVPAQNDQAIKAADGDNATVNQVAAEEQVQQVSEPAEPESSAAQEPKHTVIAYYFYGTMRCSTCRTIEAYTEEAIRNGFQDELQNGALEWRAVNVNIPENEHFIRDYELSTRSVVLVDMRDGQQKRWQNLSRVWRLVRDKEAFTSYIQEETKNYLVEKHE